MQMPSTPTGCGIAPLLRAWTSWPPTITFTVDQPVQAATLKITMIMAPSQPNEKREIVIWRRPSLGPRVDRKATGRAPRRLKRIIATALSQKPSANTLLAIAPSATVEMTRLAESHIVKLSKIRKWARSLAGMRTIPRVSIPGSSWRVSVPASISGLNPGTVEIFVVAIAIVPPLTWSIQLQINLISAYDTHCWVVYRFLCHLGNALVRYSYKY